MKKVHISALQVIFHFNIKRSCAQVNLNDNMKNAHILLKNDFTNCKFT